jgi:putative PIN family toxin of toxin-antitoxin system
MKIVLDTNIIVSAFLNPRGIPEEIISMVLSKKIEICYDNKIIAEYSDVLIRSKFDFDKEFVNDFLDFIKVHSEYVLAKPQKIIFTDEDDKKFYDVLKSSDANYIVTGNKKHYPKEKAILSPKEFKERLW